MAKPSEEKRLLTEASKAKHPACKRALTAAARVIGDGDRPGASMKLIKKGERLLDKAIRTCAIYED